MDVTPSVYCELLRNEANWTRHKKTYLTCYVCDKWELVDHWLCLAVPEPPDFRVFCLCNRCKREDFKDVVENWCENEIGHILQECERRGDMMRINDLDLLCERDRCDMKSLLKARLKEVERARNLLPTTVDVHDSRVDAMEHNSVVPKLR